MFTLSIQPGQKYQQSCRAFPNINSIEFHGLITSLLKRKRAAADVPISSGIAIQWLFLVQNHYDFILKNATGSLHSQHI